MGATCLLTLSLSPLPMSEPFSSMRLTVRFVHFSLSPSPWPALSVSASPCPAVSRRLTALSPPRLSSRLLCLLLSLPRCLFLHLVSFLSVSLLPPSLPLSWGPSVYGTLPLHPDSMLAPRVSAPPPRLREIPQPEQHRGPERGVSAPRAPSHSPRLPQGRPPRSPNLALHPLALPSPLWGDSGVTGKKVKGAGGGGKGFFLKIKKSIICNGDDHASRHPRAPHPHLGPRMEGEGPEPTPSNSPPPK